MMSVRKSGSVSTSISRRRSICRVVRVITIIISVIKFLSMSTRIIMSVSII